MYTETDQEKRGHTEKEIIMLLPIFQRAFVYRMFKLNL